MLRNILFVRISNATFSRHRNRIGKRGWLTGTSYISGPGSLLFKLILTTIEIVQLVFIAVLLQVRFDLGRIVGHLITELYGGTSYFFAIALSTFLSVFAAAVGLVATEGTEHFTGPRGVAATAFASLALLVHLVLGGGWFVAAEQLQFHRQLASSFVQFLLQLALNSSKLRVDLLVHGVLVGQLDCALYVSVRFALNVTAGLAKFRFIRAAFIGKIIHFAVVQLLISFVRHGTHIAITTI